ncbi:MAG: hypothetical protein J3R72DRAFT_451011 [Linnemannia gamsii]|nr:MAG: hypothetical protein J3R72DRAFT_451011 [Linnemannia gamsii]
MCVLFVMAHGFMVVMAVLGLAVWTAAMMILRRILRSSSVVVGGIFFLRLNDLHQLPFFSSTFHISACGARCYFFSHSQTYV